MGIEPAGSIALAQAATAGATNRSPKGKGAQRSTGQQQRMRGPANQLLVQFIGSARQIARQLRW